jgi:hypothetical protein
LKTRPPKKAFILPPLLQVDPVFLFIFIHDDTTFALIGIQGVRKDLSHTEPAGSAEKKNNDLSTGEFELFFSVSPADSSEAGVRKDLSHTERTGYAEKKLMVFEVNPCDLCGL